MVTLKFGNYPNCIIFVLQMRLVNKKILVKLKKKNRGNVPLTKEIDKLIEDI